MGKLVVSLDGVVIKEVQLTKEKTILGRRPYNDIVIDNLAVSGEHAQLHMIGNDVFIEDLNSTNGTYINGKAVRKQLLTNNDTVEIGKYKIKFITEVTDDFERTMIMRPGQGFGQSAPSHASPPVTSSVPLSPPVTQSPSFSSNFGGIANHLPASIKVLNGAAAGREVTLTKVVTTVGKPGVQVASITKRPSGYVFAHVEGAARPAVNGQPLGNDAVPLRNGDVIELAGTEMQFVQA
jgi:pSer/pThr/pTyr-binding forkhead associated (FHA) protein